MRWYWIDRFLEFESGRYAKAIKAISLAEDHLHDHFPSYPVIPNTLVIEGLAQVGGLLVCEHNHFTEKVVLAKISKVRFYGQAIPGDTLVYRTDVDYIKENGAMVTGTAHLGDELYAKAELVFAHLAADFDEHTLFEPKAFLQMMRMLGAYEIGHNADGSPLTEPAIG
ncbi:MAG: 3-hydroxyacyl-ACP dehydratase FabZ family protein [Planctomycetia bacterium]|jgi:3-hydroxyacyl-[acyl-carrier-protein] dehydratase